MLETFQKKPARNGKLLQDAERTQDWFFTHARGQALFAPAARRVDRPGRPGEDGADFWSRPLSARFRRGWLSPTRGGPDGKARRRDATWPTRSDSRVRNAS